MPIYNKQLKTKNMEKKVVHQGIVTDIKPINSQFGTSYLITLAHGAKYYFNSKQEEVVKKMFELEKKAAFTANEKVSKTGNTYSVIDQVFYTF